MNTWTKIVLIPLFLLSIIIWAQVVKSPSINGPEVIFFDVGQGDSELIQKGDFQILIDGGPNDSILSELGENMPISDRKIEIVILSHPHADHLTGLNQVLSRYEIGEIYSNGVLDTTDQYLEFLDKIKSMKISYKVPEINDVVVPFDDANLTFLWPGTKYKEQSLKNLNNSSEVVKFCYFSFCSMYTGDIEQDEQEKMISYYTNLNPNGVESTGVATSSAQNLSVFKSDILKVPHHGSSNGAGVNFFNAVAPKYAVIEVGAKNMYGHPNQTTLDLLQKLNVQILRTDQDGIVKFRFTRDGVQKE